MNNIMINDVKKNKKPIIGILNPLKIVEGHPYDTVYKTVRAYVEKIESIDCVPVGLLNVEKNYEVLDLCDAFILPGGNIVTKDHYFIIRHCIQFNKPLLGICLGMQSMILYDYLSEGKEEVCIDDLYSKYHEIRQQNISILEKVDNKIHGGDLCSGKLDANYSNVQASKHEIDIKEGTLLFDIFKQKKRQVISMHQYGAYKTTRAFREIAYADDSVLEAIEYHDQNYFVLGVQFHIETDNSNDIFLRFKEEIMKRSSL